MEGFAILPAAITMVAGPQIISAVVLATSRDAKRVSLAYIAGVACAVVLGTVIAFGIVQALEALVDEKSEPNTLITYGVVALLAFAAIRAFLGRKSAEPPKWMTSLQQARPGSAFKLGFILFLIMPTDVVMMFTVAGFLRTHGLAFVHSWPFILLTLTLISLPLLAYVLLGKRAEKVLPAVREWMNRYSWAINVGICAYFIISLLS